MRLKRRCAHKLKFHGTDMDTDTNIRMCLSCNFVNMYTMFIMYSTRTRVHAHLSNGHPREEKRACRTKVRQQFGEDRRACPAHGKLSGPRLPRQADCRATSAGAGHADFRARILARKSARKSVSVSVSVSCLLYTSPSPRDRTRSRMPSSA